MHGNGFLSRGFTDRREILHECRFGHISDRFSPILGRIAPGMAEFWASTGDIWRNVFLAEALVVYFGILRTICIKAMQCVRSVSCLVTLQTLCKIFIAAPGADPEFFVSDTGQIFQIFSLITVHFGLV